MQKAFDLGIEKLETHEMIEILLFHIIPRGNTNEIAHRLLNKFGNLYNMCHASVNELTSVEGVGTKTAEYLKMLPTYVKLYELGVYGEKPYLDTLEKLGNYCVSLLKDSTYEKLYILFLNARKQLVNKTCLGIGDGTTVRADYKYMVRNALACNPVYAVVTHNHPSGVMMASQDDRKFTQDMRSYLQNINIVLFDHILVADGEYMSFKEENQVF